MARRIHATGVTLQNNGARVFSVAMGAGGTPMLTDITAAFAFANVLHYHYEVGDVGSLGEMFTVPGPPAPAGLAAVGGGSFWVPCSTNPPGPMIWPNGSTKIELTTHNRQLSGRNTGTMKHSAAGSRVYRANDLLMWIPAAYSAGNSTPTIWDVDF